MDASKRIRGAARDRASLRVRRLERASILLTRATLEMEQAAAQRAGVFDVHAAALEKRRLRPEMLAGPIAHLTEVGGLARRDLPELVVKLRYKPSDDTYVAHMTAARSLQAAAQEHKEELAPYMLSEAVVDVFGQLLDQFDAAVKIGTDGRAAHTGATKRLDALALEAGKFVRAMDARNRTRFKNDPQTLGGWITASTIKKAGSVPTQPPAPSGTPASRGDVRPAA